MRTDSKLWAGFIYWKKKQHMLQKVHYLLKGWARDTFLFWETSVASGVLLRYHLRITFDSTPFMLPPAPSFSLICSHLPSSSFPLKDFLCKWIAYVNAACSGFIARAQQHPPVTYDKQGGKKMPIWLLWNPPSLGKAPSERLSLPFLSFIIILSPHTVYCIPSLLSPTAQFSQSLFVVTFFLL